MCMVLDLVCHPTIIIICRCRDQKVVIDKGLDGLSNEMCGNDTTPITGHLEQSKLSQIMSVKLTLIYR